MIKKEKLEKGNVVLLLTLFMSLIGASVIIGSSENTVTAVKENIDAIESKQSYATAESALEDVVYRIKNGLEYQSTQTLSLGGATSEINVTSLLGGGYDITTIGNKDDKNRIIQARIVEDVGVAFNYGVQVGRGGISLSGSSGIEGNVYANGNIVGTGSSTFITGSAVAANSGTLQTIEENVSPLPPTNDLVFANNNSTQDFAQSFVNNSSDPINKVSFYIKKTSTPSNATVKIQKDNNGSPSSVFVASGTLTSSLVSTSYAWVDVTFTTNPTLNVGETYWIVIDAGTHSTRYYTIGTNNNGYINGGAKIGTSSSVWSLPNGANVDGYFKLYTGGIGSSISGPSQWNRMSIGTGGSGIAHAETVTGVSATGNIYCQTGTGNNKSCNTSLGIPVEQPWPISDGNIEAWQAEALAGGTTNGNVSVGGSSTQTIGPRKIVGNVTVSGSGILKVDGTLWITGNLDVSGSGQLKLNTTYGANSGVIVVDGNVIVAGSSPVTGSGTAGSYILLVSLSDCPTSSSCNGTNAIDISGSAGAVALIAQNGTINFTGSASAKQATGDRISLSGSTVVEYESGLANLSFSSGPSGSFEISSWKELE